MAEIKRRKILGKKWGVNVAMMKKKKRTAVNIAVNDDGGSSQMLLLQMNERMKRKNAFC
jgi:hypothetical protein